MALEWRNKWRTKAEVLSKYVPRFKLLIFDVETTGLSEDSKIIQFSAIQCMIQNDMTLCKIKDFNQYINPRMEISEKITKITGITNNDVSDMPDESEIGEEILKLIASSDVIAGYNVSFDIGMVQKMAERIGVSYKKRPFIDVCEMARDCINKSDIEKHRLENVVKFLFPDSEFTFHNSMDDVMATALVLETLIKIYADLEPDENKIPAHLEKAKLFVNPKQKSMQRIVLKLSVGGEGDIFYDIPGHYWSCKSSPAAKKLFKQVDMCDLEYQFFKKYVYPFKYNNVDDVAKSWLKFARERKSES